MTNESMKYGTDQANDGDGRAVGGPVADIDRERTRQSYAEGFDQEHDDKHVRGELARAAAAYALAAAGKGYDAYHRIWPTEWDKKWFKGHATYQSISDRRRMLVKAGALIVAEIDRLDRITASAVKDGG